MSSYERPVRRGAYVAVLRSDLPSPLLPESDEEGAADTTGGTPKDTSDKPDQEKPRTDSGRVRIDFAV